MLPLSPQPNPFAALGNTGNAFGSGGFNFGIGSAPQPAADAEEGGADGNDNEPAVEEECQVRMLAIPSMYPDRFFVCEHSRTLHTCLQAEFKPVVQLDEVETSTGEEEEDALIEL